jgi:hypothetical protein
MQKPQQLLCGKLIFCAIVGGNCISDLQECDFLSRQPNRSANGDVGIYVFGGQTIKVSRD